MGIKVAGALAILIISLSCTARKDAPSTGVAPRTSPVQVGEMAPDFTLEDQDRQKITLSSVRGTPIVLVFYRGHW